MLFQVRHRLHQVCNNGCRTAAQHNSHGHEDEHSQGDRFLSLEIIDDNFPKHTVFSFLTAYAEHTNLYQLYSLVAYKRIGCIEYSVTSL